MTQVSKTDELFGIALPLAMYVFIMIVIIASIEYYGNWISEQQAMVIIVGGALGFAGVVAFGMMICELANTRRLRAIDITIYALLAALYALLAGMTLAYYREAWVIPYSIFGIVGVFAAGFAATELLGRLPN
jgi:nitrate reductase gamma subunit